MTLDSQRRIAMLIDGDNAQASLIKPILAKTATYGIVTTRRIYGDWTTSNMSGWKETLPTYALQPIQQFSYTVGKNATDIALIIDAMDLLHSQTVDGFCIVSSDSDYTRLATRIREQGLFVMGIGRADTPKPFVNACEIFIQTESLSPRNQSKAQTAMRTAPQWTRTVERAIEQSVKVDGWSRLGDVSNNVLKLDPEFKPSKYGNKKLSKLLGSHPGLFEMRQPVSGQFWVRKAAGSD